ncbi:MAG: protein kinase [Mobilicoccus sp.]|nr:protein kinase [Mobilicoccus sp.]
MTTEPVDPRGGVARLGPYRLHGLLGEGGMGIVHLGVDDAGRAAAVKVLRDHLAHDDAIRARLSREVDSLRRVDHPAVAPFLGSDVDGPRPYIVTRYVPGDPLDRWVDEHGPLRGDALTEFGDRLGEALDAIHDAGVVHRDLKPGNVLMPSGSPVVIDFGIAQVADEARLTSTGLVMGTPGYLAPELLDGHDVTPATDRWGWAATVAFAATGRAPFGAGPAAVVLDRVRRGEVDVAGLPGSLADLLRAGLDQDPARRPSLQTLRAGLRRAVDDGWDTRVVPAPAAPTVAVPQSVSRPAPRTEVVDPSQPDPRRTQSPARPLVAGGAAARDDAPTTVTPVVSTRVMPVVPSRPEPQTAAPSGYAGFSTPVARGPASSPDPIVSPDRPQAYGATPQPQHAMPASGYPQPSPAPARPDLGPPPHPVEPQRIDDGRRSRRTGTLLALGFFVIALTGYLPMLGLLVALGWSCLARGVDRMITSVAIRRHERGRRDRDLPVAILLSPVHLLGAAFSALVAGILPLLVGLAFALGLRALASDVSGVVLGTASMIMIGAAAALIVAWWGPGSGTMRRGSRSIVRGVSPGRPGAIILGGVALAAAVVLGLMTQSSGYTVSWWPVEGFVASLPFWSS